MEEGRGGDFDDALFGQIAVIGRDFGVEGANAIKQGQLFLAAIALAFGEKRGDLGLFAQGPAAPGEMEPDGDVAQGLEVGLLDARGVAFGAETLTQGAIGGVGLDHGRVVGGEELLAHEALLLAAQAFLGAAGDHFVLVQPFAFGLAFKLLPEARHDVDDGAGARNLGHVARHVVVVFHGVHAHPGHQRRPRFRIEVAGLVHVPHQNDVQRFLHDAPECPPKGP